eukprot:SAG11_NODE_365_length_10153_cov_3.204695_6_plen_112_part_00
MFDVVQLNISGKERAAGCGLRAAGCGAAGLRAAGCGLRAAGCELRAACRGCGLRVESAACGIKLMVIDVFHGSDHSNTTAACNASLEGHCALRTALSESVLRQYDSSFRCK